jgi:hypothetical protein
MSPDPRKEAEAFIARFEESNKCLFKMFEGTGQSVRFSSDMSMYSETHSFSTEEVGALLERFALMMAKRGRKGGNGNSAAGPNASKGKGPRQGGTKRKQNAKKT